MTNNLFLISALFLALASTVNAKPNINQTQTEPGINAEDAAIRKAQDDLHGELKTLAKSEQDEAHKIAADRSTTSDAKRIALLDSNRRHRNLRRAARLRSAESLRKKLLELRRK